MYTTSAKIASLYYPVLGANGTVSLVTGANYQIRQIDALANNVNNLSEISYNYKSKQAKYRRQVQEFLAAGHDLYRSANSNKRATAGQGADAQALSRTVNAYNNLVGTLGETELSAKGKTLLSGLQAAFANNQENLAAIGIDQDKASGKLTLAEKTLKQAMNGDKQTVGKTLDTIKAFGQELAEASEPVIGSAATDFLPSPAVKLAADYKKQLSQNNFITAYSKGIFLDLMA